LVIPVYYFPALYYALSGVNKLIRDLQIITKRKCWITVSFYLGQRKEQISAIALYLLFDTYSIRCFAYEINNLILYSMICEGVLVYIKNFFLPLLKSGVSSYGILIWHHRHITSSVTNLYQHYATYWQIKSKINYMYIYNFMKYLTKTRWTILLFKCLF